MPPTTAQVSPASPESWFTPRNRGTIYRWLLVIILGLLLPLSVVGNVERAPVFLLVPLLWLIRWPLLGRLTPATPLNGAIWLLFLMIGVSMWATYDLNLSIGKVTALFYGLVLVWGVVDWVGESRARFWWGVGALFVSGWGVVILSLVGTRWSVSKIPVMRELAVLINRSQPSVPFNLELINPNQVAGTLLWVVPITAVFALALILYLRDFRQRLPWRWLPVALFILTTAVFHTFILLLTQSRGGLLGLTLGLATSLAWVIGRWRPPVLAALVGLLVVATALLWWNGPATLLDPILRNFSIELGVNEDSANFDLSDGIHTLTGRQEIWSRAIYGLQDFPFTGMGMNTFREVVHILYPLFLISPTTDIAHAHNHLLQTGLDLGLPGLVAYLALWVGLGGMLWRLGRHNTDRWVWVFVLGVTASLVGYFVYGIFDAVALGAKPGFIFWLLVGLVTAVHQQTPLPKPLAEEPPISNASQI